MRAEMARLFISEHDRPVIYDEFTSVVDRQVAQVSSYAVSKYIRRMNRQFLAVSCHRDIIDWLDPDWIFDTDKNAFEWRRLRCRPEIKLDIRYAEEKEWQLFKNYHYLSGQHHHAANKFIAEIKGEPVAWCSILHFPHPTVKNIKRVHRVVVRPDYQGLGIGMKFLNFICELYREKGYRVLLVTGLAFFAKALARSCQWRMTRCGIVAPLGKTTGRTGLKKVLSSKRSTASFEFVGG